MLHVARAPGLPLKGDNCICLVHAADETFKGVLAGNRQHGGVLFSSKKTNISLLQVDAKTTSRAVPITLLTMAESTRRAAQKMSVGLSKPWSDNCKQNDLKSYCSYVIERLFSVDDRFFLLVLLVIFYFFKEIGERNLRMGFRKTKISVSPIIVQSGLSMGWETRGLRMNIKSCIIKNYTLLKSITLTHLSRTILTVGE